MIFVYLFLVGFPGLIIILKIKHKEYDEPMLFIVLIAWIIIITVIWYYFELFSMDSPKIYDPDFIWKN